MPPTTPFPGLREIQPGVFPKQQLGHTIPRPGRVPGIVEDAQVMLAPVYVDVSLEVVGILDPADPDESGCVGAAPLLIECVLLVRDDPKIAPAIVKLVAVDMVDLALDIRIEQFVEDHRLPFEMGRGIPTLSMVPGMLLDQWKVQLVK
jgi:hypothetical protein